MERKENRGCWQASASVGALTLAMLLGSTAAYAQETPAPAAEDQSVEAIVVTGSRIARPDLASASPLTVVGDEEFRLAGAVNVEQVINTLPQVIPGTTAFSNNPGGGVATLDLRGLGAQRTLVLVNGRRYAFFSTAQTVDLNTIPQFLIDGVDVVTGGASAVYGSDAISGVVNFRLRNDLEGVQIGSQYAITEKGDGQRWNINAALGSEIDGGKGHVTMFADYNKRGSIFGGSRKFSRTALGENATDTGLVFSGNTTVPQGRFVVAPEVTVSGGGQPDRVMPRGVGNFGTSLGSFYTAPGQSRPFAGATQDGYNFYPDNYLMVPQERWLVGAYGNYEVNDHLDVYSELTYANNRVENELAPTPVTGSFAIATNNPFLSAADRAALAQIDANEAAINAERAARGLAPLFNDPGFVNVNVFRRITDVEARHQAFEYASFRALFGAKGALNDNLSYDTYYMYSRTRNSVIQEGNVSRSGFAAALRGNRLNIFGPNTITPEMAEEFLITAQNTTTSQLQVGSASVSGSLFNLGLGGDDVGFALGTEWRQVSSKFIPDTALSSGDVIGFNAGEPTAGGYNVKEVFGELLIPIAADMPFIDDLTARGAARYSDYSLDAVGGVFTWAAGLEWAPISDIRFRGQFQRAIRAPSVGELYGGQAQGFSTATDPCSDRGTPASRTQALRDLCIATGVPASAVFTRAVQPNSQVEGIFGGNPDLEEETSDTYTIGAVIRPSFVPGLNVTVDYYNIKIEDYVASLAGGVAGILDFCYNNVRDPNDETCRAIARDPLTGAIGGDFLVTALNANISTFKTSGVDLQVDYSTDVGFGLFEDESRLNFSFLGTWIATADYTPVASFPDETTKCAGTFGTTCSIVYGDPVPEYKFTSRLSWIDGPLTTSLRFRYIGEITNENIVNAAAAARQSVANGITVDKLKEKGYFDLSLSYDVNEAVTFNVGVNNIFDVTPTLIDDSNDEQSSTYPSTYDVLGRDFFISATVRF